MVFIDTHGKTQVKQVKLFLHLKTNKDMLLLNKHHFDYDCKEPITLIIDSKIYPIALKRNDVYVRHHSNKPSHPNFVDYKDQEWYPIEKFGHVTHEDYDFYYIYVVE